MSRTKSILLTAAVILAVIIIHAAFIKNHVYNVPSFSSGYKPATTEIVRFADGTERRLPLVTPEGKKLHVHKAIEQAWREGVIRFEGGTGLSEEDPLVVRMNFPRRDHESDLDALIALYLKHHIPGSTFVSIAYHVDSDEPGCAIYKDADGVERWLWLDARYAIDWEYWIGLFLPPFAGVASVFIYTWLRRRKKD